MTEPQYSGVKLTAIARLLRLGQPAGIVLLLWPALWGATLGAQADGGTLPVSLLLILALGALVMRPFGCIANDLTDRKLDSEVARTKDRPLASGAISQRNALFMMFLLGFAAFILLLQLPERTYWVAALAVPMVIVYPWMKRFTWWPQLFLGVTFNLGVWIGWYALQSEFSVAVLWLYLAAICWTVAYDTIYALQDVADDAAIGIKSTARYFGKHLPLALLLLFGGMAASLLAALIASDASLWAYLLMPTMLADLLWQWVNVKPDQGERCARLFRHNMLTGLWVWLVIAAI